MKKIIKTNKDLENFIAQYGDHDPYRTYLSINRAKQCFALFGCACAREAFRFVNAEFDLVITDKNYDAEIIKQTNAENPELEGFYLSK